MGVEHFQSWSNEYERAEADFLSSVRTEAHRTLLAGAARRVSTAANAFNVEAYRKFYASEDDALDAARPPDGTDRGARGVVADVAASYES